MRRTISRLRELDFLIACASPSRPDDGAQLGEIAAGLDWTYVERLARAHLVRPLLFRTALGLGLVSGPTRVAWSAALRGNAVRNLEMTRALAALGRAFAAAGVPLLPHKGPLLALVAYKDIALREFSDLDVLVPENLVPTALSVLADLGYLRDPQLTWLSSRALPRWTGETSCVSAGGIAVDLHWRLTRPHHPLQLDTDLIWRRTHTISVAGADLTTLDIEALFILLSVHGAKHGWEALGWVTDLAWLVDRHAEFDWSLTLELADQTGCSRPVLLAAALIRETFQTPLPESLISRVEAEPAVVRLRDRVFDRWSAGEDPRGHAEILRAHAFESFDFDTSLSTRRGATLRHLLGLILYPTENDWRAFRLPESLFFLYSLGRIMRFGRGFAFAALTGPRRSTGGDRRSPALI